MTQIKIAYRQIIDCHAYDEFSRNVFYDSFNTFYMQSQAYNPNNQLKTYHEIVQHDPEASSLRYTVGAAIGVHIKRLNKIIPGLEDTMGEPVYFDRHRFEIIHADISDKASYQAAIVYITHGMELLSVAGEYLVLRRPSDANDAKESFTLKLQPNLSIIEWKQTTAFNFENLDRHHRFN